MQEGEKYDKIWNNVLIYVLDKRKESFKELNKVVCEDDAMIDELELCDEVEFVNFNYNNHSSATNDEISGIQNNSFINDDI